jgi:hydrazine synthase alpha subunit-like protein
VRPRVTVLLVIAVIAGLAVTRHSLLTAAGNPADGLVFTVAAEYEPLAWLQGGERFPRGAQIIVHGGSEEYPLVRGFAASADPEISFDGTHILFSGKRKKDDHWQIWEIASNGGGLRPIAAGRDDLIRPLYLPDGRIVFAKKQDGRFVIEAMNEIGGAPEILFFAPGSALPSDVLRDGRVLFQSSYPLGGTSPEIYTVYPDGSGVESYRCDHGSARFNPRQISSGDIVFTKARSLARFTSPIAHEVAIATPAGEYSGDIAEIATGEWLVPLRRSSKQPFELIRSRPEHLIPTSFIRARENVLQPRVLAPRPVPNRFPSALHDWKTANLLALDVYTSKYSFARGSVAFVRVYSTDTDGEVKVLGTAPVENDGSFFIRVPGNRPLKFEVLDKQSRSLHKQQGWMWARAGEQRVCVGCHAGPEHAPENAVPAVLQRSTTPTDLTGPSAVRTGGN